MQNKEKLNKLLDIFEELLKLEGNEWLVDALLEKIKKVTPIAEIATHPLIKDIHEYCVEKVILKQANEFYKDFSIINLKEELVRDFIKMEHERRRDNFENFSFCIYQQIENITNYLFDEFLIKQWDYEKNKPAIKSYFDYQIKQHTFPKIGARTLKSLIFDSLDDNKWYFNHKFKVVLFFYYFNKDLINDFNLNSLFFIYN